MRIKDAGMLALALLAPQAAGALGSFFTASAIPEWYATLVRPELAPPNWVFAPVWTTLFLLMGLALFLVWQKRSPMEGIRIATLLFFAQLCLNVLWSVLFFGMQNPGLALAEIGILWLSILATILVFFKVSRTAALLLVPYLLWVTFAAYLNYQFWMLNG